MGNDVSCTCINRKEKAQNLQQQIEYAKVTTKIVPLSEQQSKQYEELYYSSKASEPFSSSKLDRVMTTPYFPTKYQSNSYTSAFSTNHNTVRDSENQIAQQRVKVMTVDNQNIINFLSKQRHGQEDGIFPAFIVPHPLKSQESLLFNMGTELISRRITEGFKTSQFQEFQFRIEEDEQNALARFYQEIISFMKQNQTSLLTSFSNLYQTILIATCREIRNQRVIKLLFFQSQERKSFLSNSSNPFQKNPKRFFEFESKRHAIRCLQNNIISIKALEEIKIGRIQDIVNARLKENSVFRGVISFSISKKTSQIQNDINICIFQKCDHTYVNFMLSEIQECLNQRGELQNQEIGQQIDIMCASDNFCFTGVIVDVQCKQLYVLIGNEYEQTEENK